MRGLTIFAVVLTLFSVSASGQTNEIHGFAISYISHARGVNAGQVDYMFTIAHGVYEGTSERRLTGMARFFLGDRQDFDYSARGTVGADGVVHAQSYQHQDYGRRRRVVRVTFGPDGPVTVAVPPMGMGHPPATSAQKAGTIDQVSLVLQMLLAQGDPCRQTYHVFMDGRSRFDLALTPNGHHQVAFPGYRGDAARCSARFQPIAGFSDPQQPERLTFLFAHVSNHSVPVLIEMPTDAVGIVQLQVKDFRVA